MATEVTDAIDKAFEALGFDGEDISIEGPEPEDEAPEAVDETPEDVEEPASSEDEDPDDEEVDEDAEEPQDDEDPDPDAETYTVKVDGEDVEVDLDELLKGYQRHGDYTKKTQELADQRRALEEEQQKSTENAEFREQVESWYAEMSSNPADWVREIAQESPDPTATIARALKTLAEEGVLDPEFVETFGLTAGEVAKRASQGESEDRLSRVEREMQERREAEQARQQQEELIAEYRRQWSELKSDAGLSFDSVEEEKQLGVDVLEYARDHEITDLKVAYRALDWERSRSQPPKEKEPATPAPDPEVAKRKRSARAISPRSASNPAAKPPKAKSDREAALQAFEAYAT